MMRMTRLLAAVAAGCLSAAFVSGQNYISDVHKTSQGDLQISIPGHAVVCLEFAGKAVWIDPVMPYVIVPDNPPPADLILITHEHGDHLDAQGIASVQTPKTQFVFPPFLAKTFPGGKALKNGEKATVLGIPIEAVPAYNIEAAYHPKGAGNGYILTFGNLRVYVAGDTENVPEVKALKNIDIAVLPMSWPYTMSEEMLADAAKAITPKILYVYHVEGPDYDKLKSLLKDTGIDLRIRS